MKKILRLQSELLKEIGKYENIVEKETISLCQWPFFSCI